jgi:hypothetical protein
MVRKNVRPTDILSSGVDRKHREPVSLQIVRQATCIGHIPDRVVNNSRDLFDTMLWTIDYGKG